MPSLSRIILQVRSLVMLDATMAGLLPTQPGAPTLHEAVLRFEEARLASSPPAAKTALMKQ